MTIPFRKVSATGNDFVLIDHRHPVINAERLADFARDVCALHTGVGADGVLLLENDHDADYRMIYYNADGSRGEMCGNGARALGWFARKFHLWENSGTFTAGDGEHRIFYQNGRFGVTINANASPRSIDLENGTKGWRLNTGVPHLVIFSNDVGAEDVAGVGRRYRHDERFAPAGTNVDFVERTDFGLRMRTYERGVEEETLACGTGVIASAIVAQAETGLNLPAEIQMPGGKLEVENADESWILWGGVEEIFNGELHLGGRINQYVEEL